MSWRTPILDGKNKDKQRRHRFSIQMAGFVQLSFCWHNKKVINSRSESCHLSLRISVFLYSTQANKRSPHAFQYFLKMVSTRTQTGTIAPKTYTYETLR